MNTDRTNIIAAFSEIADAQRAMGELQSHGYSRGDLRLIPNDQVESQPGDSTLGANESRSFGSSSSGSQNQTEHRSGIMNFFSRMFGLDDSMVDSSNYHQTQDDRDRESRRYFEDHYQQRRHLVIVSAANDRSEVVRILESCGGIVEDRASQFYDQELQRSGRSMGQEQSIELREEELRARTQSVQTGEVTLRKEVVTETRNIEVPVSREEVVIERHRLSENEVARAGATRGDEEITMSGSREEIRIPVSEERVIVDKTVVPREEVKVSTRRVEGTERVSEDVKREEIRVERDGDADLAMQSEIDEDRIDDESSPIDFDKPQDERARRKNQNRPASQQPYV